MKTEVNTTTPKLFLTDYASYNNGTQMEFGHWVELSDFSSAEELQEYISNHFKEADIKSPLDSPREETMFTDFEGFPKSLYGESMNTEELEKIFKYIALDWENKSDSEKVDLWNEYCRENNIEDEIYTFDEEFFDTYFNGKPMEAARAASFGTLNWSDEYIRFNGYANLESFSDPSSVIEEDTLIEWLIENQ